MPSQATRPPLVGTPAVWLRDNCPCPLCRDPVCGQRLLHVTDIPADIAVAEVVSSGGTVSVLFHPDGHRAVFDRDWLARHAGPAVAASLGYVRETNYGRLFDVRVESSPPNLAFTSLPIPPHTDQDPEAFATLAVTPVTFGYRDAATELSATRPLISLDAQGRIREIRIDPRSLQPAGCPAAGHGLLRRVPRVRGPAWHRAVESAVAVAERAATGIIRRKDRI